MLRRELADETGWDRFWEEIQGALHVEELIARDYRELEHWHHFGWCDVCARASRFRCDWSSAEGGVPNFRERLVCEHCALNARQRLVVRLTRELVTAEGPGEIAKSIYLYEQVTPLYRVLKGVENAEVVGSEYLGHDIPRGTYHEGVRHEDALQLSFSDGGFDLIVSNDVYEHVPDIELALREARRVLRPGGSLLATLPFHFSPKTERRARLLTDGQVEHLAPPQYHGNPLSAQGSLVFYDFGWDLLDLCRGAGFKNPRFIAVHSFFHAYLGMAGLALLADA